MTEITASEIHGNLRHESHLTEKGTRMVAEALTLAMKEKAREITKTVADLTEKMDADAYADGPGTLEEAAAQQSDVICLRIAASDLEDLGELRRSLLFPLTEEMADAE